VVGGTDSRHYGEVSDNIYRFIPIVLGPGDTARFHGTNERITVENMEKAVRFYVGLIEDATSGAE
jgi:carboxypeptidase PM20D1